MKMFKMTCSYCKDSVLDIGKSVRHLVQILTYVYLLSYMFFLYKYGVGFGLGILLLEY